MFTGTFPSEHGITNGFVDENLQLPSSLPTITETLSDQEYRTAGFSNNPWVGKVSDLNRGFDEFVEWDLEITQSSEPSITQRRDRWYSRAHTALGYAHRQPLVLLKRRFFTSNLVDRAQRWLSATSDGSEATFTFLNLMEAHSPYYPSKKAFRELGLKPPNPVEARLVNTNLLAYVLGKKSLDADQRERVMDFYDASLRYQDHQLDEILDELHGLNRFDDTMIVVCADHGKTLGEYDRSGQPPHYVMNINLNVPLLIKWPGQEQGERVRTPIELTNLHDMIQKGDRSVAEAEGGSEFALSEDFIPHTGRSSESVTHWRVLSGTDEKYIRSREGDEYVLTGPDEVETIEATDGLDTYRSILSNRVQQLEERTPEDQDSHGGDLDGNIKGQLEDLGYLN